MKLRNKRTGEIVIFGEGIVDLNQIGCKNVAEMMEAGWEDYEEPKESEYYWYIGYKNDIRRTKYHHISDFADNQVTATRKEIGNCFGSLEEAEKAVEKLKAWKRLKDKGFRFVGIAGLKSVIYFCADEKYDNAHIMFDEYGSSSDDLKQYNKDLDLLFGGEE